ncbi:MAG: YkgJ family cysteine cluster protein [Candidatus Susulua stagnicola]|nr:YkgJ family cysteine cluster protein [Candidatus Susulua stagnicola]
MSKQTSKKECMECGAICCENLAMIIGRPENKKEIEDLRWQLHFDTVKVYIHHRRWYLWVKGKCMYLTRNRRCKIYDQRPEKCRQHNPPDCEHFGDFYDILISTPDELDQYLKSKKKTKTTKAKSKKGKK